MKKRKRLVKYLHPYQLLVLGYLLITLLGAILLSLPVSTASGHPQDFLDALFVAASGISTTGLTVVDVGTFYSPFGQAVLLAIFQIGGIGYMTVVMFLVHLLSVRMSLRTHAVAANSLAGSDSHVLQRFFFFSLVLTLVFEFLGGCALTLIWWRDFPVDDALSLGFFHAISAFCTAGFGLFSDSLIGYGDNTAVNAVIIALSLIGSVGFVVILDIARKIGRIIRRKTGLPLSVHSKVVLFCTPLVIIAATLIIFFSESSGNTAQPSDKFLSSIFQAVSAQTTDGFNTVPVADMSIPSLLTFMVLMFVGASPGSTAGGIKITTMAVLFCFLRSQIFGNGRNSHIFKREIPRETVGQAFGVFLLFTVIVAVDSIVMTGVEKHPFITVVFEIVSALGNTGLSMGITPELSPLSRTLLILTMFIGRVGPLPFVYSLVGRKKKEYYKYPYGDIYVA